MNRLFEADFAVQLGQGFRVRFWDGRIEDYGRPTFELEFNSKDALRRSIAASSLGFGECYARGDISIRGNLEDVLSTLAPLYLTHSTWTSILAACVHRIFAAALKRERQEIEFHYGLGRDFFDLFLDKNLQYSCAYFNSECDSLDSAQENKIRYILKKLNLRPGQRLLDIGCGWGALLMCAARDYGVHCDGITLCGDQLCHVRNMAEQSGLPVDVKLISYKEIKGLTYDRIVSVGMMEHVGERNSKDFIQKVKKLLNPGGICLLHSIMKMRNSSGNDPFIDKYIFPNYWFYSLEHLVSASVESGFNILDIENLRRHYILTARHWRLNWMNSRDKAISKVGSEEKFKLWEFYLASVAAGFRVGYLNLIQMVATNGPTDDYPMSRSFLYM